MTDPTHAAPHDDSTPAVPTESAAPLTPPAYDSSPYVAPASPAYDAAQETAPYPDAYAPPVYAPPSYPASPYASHPQGSYPQAPYAPYAQAQYPVQTTPGAPPVMPYGYGGYAPPKTNGLAIASLVLSIVGFIWFLPLLGSLGGVILGHISLGQIKRTGDQGRGMALAGVIVGWVGLAIVAFVVLAIVLIFSASSSYRYSTYGA